MDTVLDDSLSKYLPFLVEIRKRLLFVATILVIAASVGFIYYEKVVSLALKLFQLEGVNIVFTSPFQFLNLAVSCALLVGTIAVLPILLSQVIAFLKPALSKSEFKTLLALLPISAILFITGFSFGIVIMRYVILIFYQRSVGLDIGNFLDISALLSQILVTSLLLGLAFQFPIVITLLIKMRVVKYKTIQKHRITAWIASVIFAALLPPTDLVSLVLMCLPLVFLFEVTLLLNKLLKAHLL